MKGLTKCVRKLQLFIFFKKNLSWLAAFCTPDDIKSFQSRPKLFPCTACFSVRVFCQTFVTLLKQNHPRKPNCSFQRSHPIQKYPCELMYFRSTQIKFIK